VAHGGTVNCLHIGRRSGGVLVTGGDDKKVNLWSVGKPNAIMSLSGHTSAVECVSFDSAERTVIAGSAGGTLKMWDLEHGRVARTLTGHRSNCVAVQWHPYGEFFASGSVDTNLKIWDIRRRACIQTYRGHSRAVCQILFSPDGRWVVSGGDDGVVKLWDLTAGKLLHEFTTHPGPISALAVHPTEFLMATVASDRTIRLWDLETFAQVCQTPPDLGQVRRALFSEDGANLLSGGEESLRVWGWEPVRCHEQAEVRWSKLADMCVAPGNQLVAGSIKEAVVTVWQADLTEMRPFNGAAPPTPDGAATPAALGGGGGYAGGGGGGYARRNTPASRAPATATPPSRIHGMDAFGDAPPLRQQQPAPRSAPPFALHDDSHNDNEEAPPERAPARAASVAVAVASASAGGGAADAGCGDDDDLSVSACARLQIADCRAQIAAVRRTRSSGDGAMAAAGAAAAQHEEEIDAPPPRSAPPSNPAAREIGTSMGDSLLQNNGGSLQQHGAGGDGLGMQLPPSRYGKPACSAASKPVMGRGAGGGGRPSGGASGGARRSDGAPPPVFTRGPPLVLCLAGAFHRRFIYKGDTSSHAQGTDPRVALGA